MDDGKVFHLKSSEIPDKLTDWKNEPPIATLKDDLEMAKQAHDLQMSKIDGWTDLLLVRGKARPPVVKGRSSVQPKLIRRQAEWRYSALSEPFLGSNKIFKVSPVTFEDKEAADQNELVLNWQFRTKLNRVKLIDDFVRATVDEGTSVIRLGWKRHTIMVKETVPVWSYYPLTSEQDVELFRQAIEFKQEDPRHFEEKMDPAVKAAVEYYEETGDATTAIQTGSEQVDVEKVLENRPTVEIMNPKNVFIDPTCGGDMDKALFVALSFETSYSELLKEPNRYKKELLEKVNWQDGSPIMDPDHATTTPDTYQFKDKMRKKVVAYEYWGFYDIYDNGRMIPFVATWIGNVMIRMELNPFPDEKLPFVVVPYLPVKRELYGEPDAELLEDNQKILGAVTRGMIDLMGRSANSQQGFAKGMLDPLNRRRYENGQDYEFNPNQNPSQGLLEHKYPEIPQSAMLMLNLQNQEAEAMSGVKSFAGGISGEAFGDVAAGIRGVLDASSKREMAILRRLAKGMTEVGNKIIAMNAEFMSEKEIVRITNAEFVTVEREDLKGNFDLEVDISTAEVDNAKSQDLAFMLQTIGNSMDFGMTAIILAEIAKLKRMPELAHKILTFQPQPSPEEQEMAMLELEKARKEVEKLASEINLNNAKAQEAIANKEQKDLDFVEQETGTKHARDMEKQQGQARGNQNLEITKGLLKPTKQGESRPDIDGAIGFNTVSNALGSGGTPVNTIERDQAAAGDPALNLRSQNFDGSADPALNPAINI